MTFYQACQSVIESRIKDLKGEIFGAENVSP